MRGKLLLSVLAGWLGGTSVVEAQVFVRAPFVQVQVGPGVAVRAPFVNLYVPPSPRVVYGPLVPNYGPPVFAPAAPPGDVTLPLPQELPPGGQVVPPARVPTLEEFARTFQPKAGNYEVVLQNPLTGQPTSVRFLLPEGTPRRVNVQRREIEFVYGLRHFVRIEFDRDGAQVVSR